MADGIAITAGSGTTVLTDDTGAGGHAQVVKLAISTDGSGTLIPADATNGIDVDVTRMSALVAGTAYVGKVRLTDGTNDANVTATGALFIGGAVAHDGVDSGNPIKIGARAIAHGTNPTAVAAADRTDLLANRAGVPFFIGGHPNIVTYGMSITTAVTNAVIGPTVNAGMKFVATGLTVTADNANTVFPSVVIGFGTASAPAFAGTPGTTKILGGHPGVPAGGGFNRGDGSGMLGVGADDEEVRITTVGNVTGLYVVLQGYTVES